jgi:histidine triad (HIT) family protein
VSETTDCIFCKIVQGEIPADVVARQDGLMAFADVTPQAPTHLLVIPTRHIPRVTDLTPEDADLGGRMILLANKVAAEAGIAESGFRLVLNCNDHGGQSVYHIHLHVLGGRSLSWPPG